MSHYYAAVVESVDTLDSKSGELTLVPVQVRLAVPHIVTITITVAVAATVIVAIVNLV